MENIESLKSCADGLSKDKFISLIKEIYGVLDFICADYPGYKEWFFKKQIPRIFTPNGEILFVRSNDLEKNGSNIIAVACLKKDDVEKKICTLYVSSKHRGKQIGTKLLEASMEYLGTKKPFITFADYKLQMFQPFVQKYDWELTEVVSGLYNSETSELCFNGKLTRCDKDSLGEMVLKRKC